MELTAEPENLEDARVSHLRGSLHSQLLCICDTTIHVSSYYYMCVLIQTTGEDGGESDYDSGKEDSEYYICVLILLYTCPQRMRWRKRARVTTAVVKRTQSSGVMKRRRGKETRTESGQGGVIIIIKRKMGK
jgi:hypothetical protein